MTTPWNSQQLGGRVRDSAKAIDPQTGTTTDTRIEVIDLDVRQFRDTELIIENTGSASLYHFIRVRNDYISDTDFELFSNEIKQGDSDEIILARHARIYVDIISHVVGNHTTYTITGIGGT